MSPSIPATPLYVNRWWPWLMIYPDDMRARFSWRNNDLSDEDIIICEVIPGEIYLCNTLIKNRKKAAP